MEERDDNQFVKKSFFDHLKRQSYGPGHLAVYEEYFDFFLSRLGAGRLMAMDPDAIYRAALAPVEELDGEDIVEAYLAMIELFIEFFSERWEQIQPPPTEPGTGGEGI